MKDDLHLQTRITVFSRKAFVHIQLYISGRMWIFSLSNDCYIIGHTVCVVQSCIRIPTGELRSQIHIVHSVVQHCVHIVQVHTSLFRT